MEMAKYFFIFRYRPMLYIGISVALKITLQTAQALAVGEGHLGGRISVAEIKTIIMFHM